MSQYRAYFVPGMVDPRGGYVMHPQDKMDFDKYWDWWKKRHPHLNPKDLANREKTLAKGCVGITLINSGYSRISEITKSCYSSKRKAEAAQKTLGCKAGDSARLFSIHFWWKGPRLKPRPTGSIDLDPWYNGGRPKGRPAGDWDNDPNTPDDDAGVNFDFGWQCGGGTIIHADMYHNPDRDGDGKGDFYPGSKIRTATVYGSTLKEWQDSYEDFNKEVWCVVCQKKDAKCKKPKP
jgi:hypothetical protein